MEETNEPVTVETKKKHKLTKVEKKAKRKAKAEAKRRQLLKDHYTQEMRLCDINWKKCQNKWDAIQQTLDNEEMKRDIVFLKESIEAFMNVKSQQFGLILESFNDLNEQTRTLTSAHLGGLDRLLDIYDGQMRYSKENYLRSVETKKFLHKKEKENFSVDDANAKENLMTLVAGQDEHGLEEQQRCKETQDKVILDLDSKHWTDMEKLEFELEENIEWLLIELQTRLKTQLYSKYRKQEEYEELWAKDQRYLDIIFKQKFQMKKLLAEKRNLKSKLQCRSEKYSQMMVIRAKRDQILQVHLEKKAAVDNILERDQVRLRNLSVTANNTIAYLLSVWETKERILARKEICAKFEASNERKTLHSSEFQYHTFESGLEKLTAFWEHVGKIELSIPILKTVLNDLAQEKISLVSSLKKLFAQISYGRRTLHR